MSLPQNILTRLDDLKLAVGLLVEIEFASGVERFWSGSGVVTWQGKNWQGEGRILSFDKLAHDLDQAENQVSLTMPFDEDDAAIQSIRAGQGHGGLVAFDLLFFDEPTVTPVASEPLFRGFVDSARLAAADRAINCTLTCSSETALLRRRSDFMLSDDAQKRLFSDDRGLEYATNPFDTRFGADRTGALSGQVLPYGFNRR